jgi:hypothetical protein
MAKRTPKEGPMAKEPYQATRLCPHGVDTDELTCSKCIEEAKPGAIAAPPATPPTPETASPSEGEAKNEYLGDLAKGSLAATEDAGEVETDEVPPATASDPNSILRQLVLGTAAPSSIVADQVVGASILFCPRPNKWRQGTVLRLAGVDPGGNVLVDLEFASSVGGLHATCDVPYGEGVRNWKFAL